MSSFIITFYGKLFYTNIYDNETVNVHFTDLKYFLSEIYEIQIEIKTCYIEAFEYFINKVISSECFNEINRFTFICSSLVSS